MSDSKDFVYPIIYDGFRRPPEAFEKVSDESITETAGYVPSDRQIEDMIMAGYRLNQSRAEDFDFPSGEEVPDDFIDPTRSPGFDMADASTLHRNVSYRLRKQAKEASEREKNENIHNSGENASKGQESASEVK